MAEKKQQKSSLWQNWIVRNLVLAAVFVLAIVLGVNILLGVITQHNKEFTVPDFTNMTVAEASVAAKHAGLNAVVQDSVFVRRMKRGAVFMQTPRGGSRVKKGRSVRLTINAMNAKEVSMPLLVGYSMRQAKA